MSNIEKLAEFVEEQGKEYLPVFIALIETGLTADSNSNTERTA